MEVRLETYVAESADLDMAGNSVLGIIIVLKETKKKSSVRRHEAPGRGNEEREGYEHG